ncbi:AtpZ/AtpI family protein [Leptotrichia sp. oral taxon 223]|uniref:AtpZ/AtpI family protein n=1 Tax=Leptotrichia sp. oral taxon 223 TaxID=712363 RepID=UPI0015B79A54|nr:AtpZ/AtpI family protein [Leptotrichia sp. oral taxon 223]NWO18601.1 AtpZ/AtpI family protein [Leptotrichia sp. oral taxon 223]
MKLEDKKEILKKENEITDEKKTVQAEEKKQKQKIFEIEKKLGRHNNEKELKNRRNNKLMKYFALATNMVYILALPVLIMLGFYLLLKKYLFKTDQPIVLIIFLIIGAVSGYWSLIKQVNNIK